MKTITSLLRKPLLSASAACLALCVSGCVTKPDTTPALDGIAIPQDWAAPANPNGVEGEWWLSFGDPVLNQLIAESLLENTAIAQAEAQAAQAYQQVRLVDADRLPTLAGAFNASRRKQSLAGSGLGGFLGGGENAATSFENDNFALQLNVDWEIDLWGRIANQKAAAVEELLAAEESLRAVRQSVAAQTAKAYFAVVEGQQQVAFTEETVAALGETARQLSNRADIGIGAPADKQLSISNFESARAGLQQRRQALESAKRQLQFLLRDYPTGDIAVDSELPERLKPIPAGLPSELLQRRPDVLAAEKALRASVFRLEAAERSFFPSISLTGSYGTQSTELENLLDHDFSVWSIAGQLVQPIFQGGRIIANINIADAARREAAEAYAEAVLNAFLEVETALAFEQLFTEREAAQLRAFESASEAERINMNRYQEGLVPYINVLESQQRALEARSAYLEARRARLENRIDLHLALGGGALSPTATDSQPSSEDTP